MRSFPRVVSPWPWRLLCLLCWVVGGSPREGRAAEDVPRTGALRLALSGPLAGSEPADAPESALSEPTPRERYRAPQGLRLLTEVGAGLATAVAGGYAGAYGALGLCTLTQGGGNSGANCLWPFALGAVVGVAGGYGLGVWWGGEVMGGDGSLPLTLLGSALGAVAGGVLLNVGASPVGLLLSLALTVLGPHLGYELSQRAPPPGSTPPRVRLQPLLSFSASGAVWGLGGQF